MKVQYFGHLMRSADSLEKTLILGNNWGQEEKGVTEDKMVGCQLWLSGDEFEQSLGDSIGWKPGVLQSKGLKRVGHDLTTENNKWFHACETITLYILLQEDFCNLLFILL